MPLHEGPEAHGLHLPRDIEDEPLLAGIGRERRPARAEGRKFAAQAYLRAGPPAVLPAAPKAAGVIDRPLALGLGLYGHVGHEPGVGVVYPAVVEARLQLVDIAPGVLHGREAENFGDGVHYLARLGGGGVPGEIGAEALARHAAALLDGSAVPAGKQQPQEVREAARHGPDIVRRGVAGADGEDRIAVSGREAVVDAVRALAADNLSAARRAEIRLPARRRAERAEVYARSAEFFVVRAHLSASNAVICRVFERKISGIQPEKPPRVRTRGARDLLRREALHLGNLRGDVGEIARIVPPSAHGLGRKIGAVRLEKDAV